MSNINPNPSFIRKPGPPARAASAIFPYRHRTMAEITASAALCKGCRGTSHLWKVGTCETCGGHGRK